MSKLIFVFDADEQNRNTLTQVFSPMGYEVLTAEDGKQAFKTVNINSIPALIIIDCVLEEKSALDICTEVRREPRSKGVPILLMTHGAVDLAAFRKAGVREFMAKPFALKEFTAKAQKILQYGASDFNPKAGRKVDFKQIGLFIGAAVFVVLLLLMFLGPMIFKS